MCQVCKELGLVHGDVIEIDGVNDQFMAENYKLPPKTRAIILANDDYFRYMPDYLCGDPEHLTVVTKYQEPFNILVLAKKKVSWKKVGHTTPVLKTDSAAAV
jgi:hypothetical protein